MIINFLSPADSSKKTLLFDRDGTINVDSGYTSHPLKPVLTESFNSLIASDFPWKSVNFGIVSNQSGIGRAKFSLDDLFRFNAELLSELEGHTIAVQLVIVCPHLPESECECRKPSPHMITTASKLMDSKLSNVAFVGNAPSDNLAANRAGVQYFDIHAGSLCTKLKVWIAQ